MFTVNFIDDTHLLLTYNTHGLLARLPDVTPDDDDRLIAAELIELPSGKVLASTKWRTRDRLRYLWPLTHGLFLLRVRSRLTVIDPLGHLSSTDPFQPQAFLEFSRRIGYIAVSPGGDLLTVETVPQPHFQKDSAACAFGDHRREQLRIRGRMPLRTQPRRRRRPRPMSLPRISRLPSRCVSSGCCISTTPASRRA